jgi:hypothetical protein
MTATCFFWLRVELRRTLYQPVVALKELLLRLITQPRIWAGRSFGYSIFDFQVQLNIHST